MAVKKYLLAALVVAVVAALVVVGVTPLGVSPPAPERSAAEGFSAGRAMRLLREIAAAPRPIGSVGAARARDAIVAELDALHLAPHVQTASAVSAVSGRVAGTVRNVVARLPGRDPSRAVLLAAHYDSVPVAAGAADDGGGVVTLLETARALASGPRPRTDVIFLFTDGEERGLLGARAFLREDPWAYGVGVVLNFDSPGSSSPVLMYETSPGNGLLVRELVAGAPRPYTSSLMYEVSRRLPIESDFRPFSAAGVPGMSFGALDGPTYDHTAYDSLENFRAGSLQHEGDTALGLARRFGDLDLWALHREDVVYFDIVDGLAVVYEKSLVLPFVALAAAVFAVAVAVGAWRRLLSLRGLSVAVLAAAAVLGVALLVLALAWGMYRTAYEQRTWSEAGVVISDFYRLGLVLLAAAVIVAAYELLLRRLRPWDLAVAALFWWLAAAVAVAVIVPGASYLLTWPLAGASLGLLGAVLLGDRALHSVAGVAVTLAGAAPGVVLMSSATYLLLMSAGLKQVVTVIAVWLVVGLLVIPLEVVRRGFRLWLPVALAGVSVVVLMAVGSTVAFDTEHPRFTSIYYRVDESGASRWQTVDRIDEWTGQFLREELQRPFQDAYFPQMGVRTTIVGAAPQVRLAAPVIDVLRDSTTGDRRTVRLRLRSPRGAQIISLLVHSVVGGLTASVDGLPLQGWDTTILDGSTVRWWFDYYAPPPGGVVVTLRFAAGPAVLLRAVDFSYGIPPQLVGLYDGHPPGMLPGRIGDGTLVESTLRLRPSPPAGAAAAIGAAGTAGRGSAKR
ncbi:MAG: M20/M25/M40 family metallo-hydrolase [Actinobacteria bacterium]|nr:M20/M25/M40 family metallo-hydrolase [Actinomycetota bacterium]